MDFRALANFAKEGAPVIASMLLSPLAGVVTSIIANAIDSEPSAKDVYNKLKDDPQAILKLKEIESNNEEILQELKIKLLEEQNKELSNAREIEVKMSAINRSRTFFMQAIAIIILLSTIGFATYGIVTKQPLEKDILTIFAGALAVILTYYFGRWK